MSDRTRTERRDENPPKVDWMFLANFEYGDGGVLPKRSLISSSWSGAFRSCLESGGSLDQALQAAEFYVDAWSERFLRELTPEDKERIQNWDDYKIERGW